MSDYLDSFSDEQIAKAQDELNKLCDKYGVKQFNIKSKKARWKEIGLNMVGLAVKAKKAGRKKRDDDEVYKIANYIECLREFSKDDNEENGIKINDAIKKAIEQFNIKSTKYDSGNQSDPFQVVKGIRNRNFLELEKKLLQEQEKEDNSELPKAYYDNFYNDYHKNKKK